jgi:hypothetical protein
MTDKHTYQVNDLNKPQQPSYTLAFAAFIFALMSLWTILPSLLAQNLPLDSIEVLAWGGEWQAGYHKHPPLYAWLAEIFRIGSWHWPLFLLSQVMVVFSLFFSWLLARDFLKPAHAFIAVTAMASIHYLTISAIEFNVNVVQYPFWAFSALAFWRAIRSRRLYWWIALGISCGLGIIGKYTFAFLPISMTAFIFLHPDGRRELKTAGPWVAACICVAIITPNIIWNIEQGFPFIAYAMERGKAGEGYNFFKNLINLIMFLGVQISAIIPLIILFIVSLRPKLSFKMPGLDRWLIITMGIGPVIVYAIMSLVFGIELQSAWGAPLVILSGPFLMAFLNPRQLYFKRFIKTLTAFVFIFAIGYLICATLVPSLTGSWKRINFPGRDLARVAKDEWSARYDSPLKISIGDVWLAGNIAFYCPQDITPSVYIDASTKASPWLNDDLVRLQGAVVAWMSDKRGKSPQALDDSSMASLARRFPSIEELAPIRLNARWPGGSAPVYVGMAIIPPASKR